MNIINSKWVWGECILTGIAPGIHKSCFILLSKEGEHIHSRLKTIYMDYMIFHCLCMPGKGLKGHLGMCDISVLPLFAFTLNFIIPYLQDTYADTCELNHRWKVEFITWKRTDTHNPFPLTHINTQTDTDTLIHRHKLRDTRTQRQTNK